MFLSSNNKISIGICSGSLWKLLSASDPGVEPLMGGSGLWGTAERDIVPLISVSKAESS